MTLLGYHIPPGVPGFLCGLAIFAVMWALAYRRLKRGDSFTFEPRGEGSFNPLLDKYIWLSQFVIGLSTGSILLLAGTSVFKSAGRLPWEYSSPLVLLSLSVVYGVCFLAFLLRDYESFLHEFEYTRLSYSRNTALGFSALLCFAAGYLWLSFRLGLP